MNNGNMPAMPFLPMQDRHAKTSGLTKREHFAAMAMQGIVSNHRFLESLKSSGTEVDRLVAVASLEVADALLFALDNQ